MKIPTHLPAAVKPVMDEFAKALQTMLKQLEEVTYVVDVPRVPLSPDIVQRLRQTSIRQFCFGVRIDNCLIAANIYTAAELVTKTEQDLLKVVNLGRKGVRDIKINLEQNGLALNCFIN